MCWFDVVLITFSAVAANHLGLVAAVENIIRHSLPILNCIKCAAFWGVIVYGVAVANSSLFTLHSSLQLLATAFLSAWSAVWLDLFMGLIDKLYIKVYDTIYPTADTTDADALGAHDTMPDMPVG